MACNKSRFCSLFFAFCISMVLTSCFHYGFTGTSIPEDVNSVYIPFFADQSSGGINNLSDKLNEALIDRFINKTRLQLANNRSGADAVLKGSIRRYANEAFSLTGDEQTSRNEVTVSVQATYQYTQKEKAEWSSSFNGSATYDTNENPIEGETDAANDALDQVADNMFNDAVSGW